MDKPIEYFNFSTWLLIKSDKEDFIRYNKGFIADKTIGFFHEVGMNVNTGFILFAKPTYDFETFLKGTKGIKGFMVHSDKVSKDIKVLQIVRICNN